MLPETRCRPVPAAVSALEWSHRVRQGQREFLCPACGEHRSAVNPWTNRPPLVPHREKNFKPIDFTIAVERCDYAGGPLHEVPLATY